MGFFRVPSPRDRELVDQSLARVGMSDYRKRQIGELSGGQKKRVFLARALAQEGRIILLDEPFTGVDVQTETAIIDLMRELRDQGHLMLVSTHNLGSVPDFCDQVVLVNRTVLAVRPNARRVHAGQSREAPLAACCATSSSPVRTCTDEPTARRVTVLTDDERPVVFYGEHRRRRPGLAAEPRSRATSDARRAARSPSRFMTTWSRPIWVSALVGAVCAFLSAYLMLKGWSLIGDALGHAVVPGVATRLSCSASLLRRRLRRGRAGRRRDGHRAALRTRLLEDARRSASSSPRSSRSACSSCRSIRRPWTCKRSSWATSSESRTPTSCRW